MQETGEMDRSEPKIDAEIIISKCQLFLDSLANQECYQDVYRCLLSWRQSDKSKDESLSFVKELFSIINQQTFDEQVKKHFISCFSETTLSNQFQLLLTSPEKVISHQPRPIQQRKGPLTNTRQIYAIKSQVEMNKIPINSQKKVYKELTDKTFKSELLRHQFRFSMSKIIHLYLISVISLSELKRCLFDVKLHDTHPALYYYLFKYCQKFEGPKREKSVFIPLHQLVRISYPLIQAGESYVYYPKSYANYSEQWSKQPQESLMNRKYGSVCLDTQSSFEVQKKNQYEMKLYKYEEERAFIDVNVNNLKACIKQIQRCKYRPKILEKIGSPFLKKIVAEMYPQVKGIYSIFTNNISPAIDILLPRLRNKLEQMIQLRAEFDQVYQEISQKNYEKGRDYQSETFLKNDKKQNCQNRWLDEIKQRKQTAQLQEKIGKKQKSREIYLNTFKNVSFLDIIPQEKKSMEQLNHKKSSNYLRFPDSCTLFIMNFKYKSILNDALQLILFNCSSNKAKLLNYLIFKMFKMKIIKKIQMDTFQYDQIKEQQLLLKPETKKIIKTLNLKKQENKSKTRLLNESSVILENHDVKATDIQGVANAMDETLMITHLTDQSPFEGPDKGLPLIGTKIMYIFSRYLLLLYQRLLIAKQMGSREQKDLEYSLSYCVNAKEPFNSYPNSYKMFLKQLVNKSVQKEEQTTFEQLNENLFGNRAYLFLNLDKILSSTVKLINSIGKSSLTSQILQDTTKDCENGIVHWQNYNFLNVNQQLMRVCGAENNQEEMIIRFLFCQDDCNLYVSAFDFPKHNDENEKKIMKPITHKCREGSSGLINNSKQFVFSVNSKIEIQGQSYIAKPQRKCLAIYGDASSNKQCWLKQIEKIKILHESNFL